MLLPAGLLAAGLANSHIRKRMHRTASSAAATAHTVCGTVAAPVVAAATGAAGMTKRTGSLLSRLAAGALLAALTELESGSWMPVFATAASKAIATAPLPTAEAGGQPTAPAAAAEPAGPAPAPAPAAEPPTPALASAPAASASAAAAAAIAAAAASPCESLLEDLPLLPLPGGVLFPGMHVPLVLFDPTLVRTLRAVLDAGSGGGSGGHLAIVAAPLVSVEDRPEASGDGDERAGESSGRSAAAQRPGPSGHTGVLAELRRVTLLPGGGLLAVVAVRRRLRVERAWTASPAGGAGALSEGAGLLRARVRVLSEDAPPVVAPEAAGRGAAAGDAGAAASAAGFSGRPAARAAGRRLPPAAARAAPAFVTARVACPRHLAEQISRRLAGTPLGEPARGAGPGPSAGSSSSARPSRRPDPSSDPAGFSFWLAASLPPAGPWACGPALRQAMLDEPATVGRLLKLARHLGPAPAGGPGVCASADGPLFPRDWVAGMGPGGWDGAAAA